MLLLPPLIHALRLELCMGVVVGEPRLPCGVELRVALHGWHCGMEQRHSGQRKQAVRPINFEGYLFESATGTSLSS